MKTTPISEKPITPGNFPLMRKLCGIAIAAIGFSAPLASAATIPVINGGFETEYATNTNYTTNWVRLTGWSHENTNTGSVPIAGAFSSSADGGTKFTRFTWNDAGAEQNLNTNVAVGDTLSVTFNIGRSANAWGGSNNTGVVYFKIGSQFYYQDCVVSGEPAGTWKSFTFTTTATNAGALSLGFRVARTTANNQYASVDGVSDVTWTPVVNEDGAPTSTNATLAADENVATALAASNFGYADPNSSPLSNVQITSLPAFGTLKNGGTTVVSGNLPLTVSAANIGNLTYQSPMGGFGNAYTTMLIKVQNSASPTALWSAPALMTFNVTHVNHAPTSTGSSMIIGKNTVKTFAAADFPFSDIDAGDTFGAIKVTSLPANGTLSLSGTLITTVPSAAIPVANIGTLIYTPSSDYTGSDPFTFQVRDAALFSADATMALSVTADIIVQNGSFETRGTLNAATHWWSLGSPWVGGTSPQAYEVLKVNEFNTFTAAANGLYAANVESWLVSLTQNLSTTVTAGDTLSMTFSGGRAKTGQGAGSNGGKFTATFKVGTTEYTSSEFDTSLQANDTWQTYTFTTPITNTGNLSIVFKPVSGRPWLDNISNVSVSSPPGDTTYTLTYTAGANGTITGTSPQTVDYNTSGTEVTAVPAAGYSFLDWSDGSTDNPRTDSNVTADLNVTANFAINTYTLTYSAGENGSITGETPQTVDYNTSGSAVTAVPATGYRFVNWSDNSTTNPRTDTNVTGDASITANFAIDTNTYADWATANSVTGGVNGDSNNDGVSNGLAYFMGVTGQATNPGLNPSNEVTWPVNQDYQGTFKVQTSSDLSSWTDATPQPTPSGGNLTYTLTGSGKQFVRLSVTPD